MEKIRLGKTNLMVTRIGFGGIPIQTPSEKTALPIRERIREAGKQYYAAREAYMARH